jgi:hypothetical protein
MHGKVFKGGVGNSLNVLSGFAVAVAIALAMFAIGTSLPVLADPLDYHITEQNEQLTTDIPGATIKVVPPTPYEAWEIVLPYNDILVMGTALARTGV